MYSHTDEQLQSYRNAMMKAHKSSNKLTRLLRNAYPMKHPITRKIRCIEKTMIDLATILFCTDAEDTTDTKEVKDILEPKDAMDDEDTRIPIRTEHRRYTSLPNTFERLEEVLYG